MRCLEEINLKESFRWNILEFSWLDNLRPDAVDFSFD